MLRYARFRWKLGELLRRQTRVASFYSKKIREARHVKKPPNDVDSLVHEGWWEQDQIDGEIAGVVTGYLTSTARRMFLAVPNHDDGASWKQAGDSPNRYVLTEDGVAALRAAIRAERAATYEIYFRLVVAMTGLIGAATGLAAVVMRS